MSSKKQQKRKTTKETSDMPSLEQLAKNFDKKELKEALDPKKVKDMVDNFAKENMNEIIANLVGPDGDTIKEMLGRSATEQPNTNPKRPGTPYLEVLDLLLEVLVGGDDSHGDEEVVNSR